MTIPKGGENLSQKILLINIANRTMGNGRYILGKKVFNFSNCHYK